MDARNHSTFARRPRKSGPWVRGGYHPSVAHEEDLLDWIRNSVIGADEAVAGPWGLRRITYADYTASGRSLAPIEDYLRDAVLPLYANTHSESSGSGMQT